MKKVIFGCIGLITTFAGYKLYQNRPNIPPGHIDWNSVKAKEERDKQYAWMHGTNIGKRYFRNRPGSRK